MQPLALVPRPAHLRPGSGALRLGPAATLSADPRDRASAQLWRATLGPLLGSALADGGEAAILRLRRRPGDSASGAYRLVITTDGLRVDAAGAAGFAAALQTVRQLLPAPALAPVAASGAEFVLPALEIDDVPRFSWRGALLDVARHFAPLAFLYRFVDLLALHKLNVLQLHLNDDQGWRFASERYPRLIEVGAWRPGTRIGHQLDASWPEAHDGVPHGGFYEKHQLRALVAYAAARGVTIVPEIDLPGHARAAIAAYPELGSCGPTSVWTDWGVSENVLNCAPETMRFCREVWDEVLEVFPSPYVHLGGDECPKDEWERTPAVRARIAALGCAGPDALQGWFTAQLAVHLRAGGRHPIGWDEILEGGGLPTGTTVMSWRGESGGVAAARAGFDVVMCPEQPCYFDHYQSADPDEPLAFGRLNTLADVLAYEPVPTALSDETAGHVLGTQFSLWSEYLPTPAAVEYMAFPRAAAFAEVAWSPAPRDGDDFAARLPAHLERLDALGVNYRPLAGPHPWQRGGTGARRRFDRP